MQGLTKGKENSPQHGCLVKDYSDITLFYIFCAALRIYESEKLGFSKVFCLSMCTVCEDWAPALCPRSSSPSLSKSLGLKYLQWDTDNDTRQPGRGRTDSSTGCTLFIKKVRARWFGGKQKDREEMQRLKSASRIWMQSVNLRDPSRRRRRKGGGGDYGPKTQEATER